MFSFLLVVQILVSVSIISLVMLQQGKGADMGAAFGSGSSGTVFGARGSGSFFTKATGILAAVFFINCLLIASPLVRKVATGEPESIADQIEQQVVEQQDAPALQEVVEVLEQSEAGGQAPSPEDVPAMEEPVAAEDLPAAGDPVPTGAADDLPQ